MCRLCDGEDPVRLIQEDATRIAVNGYTLCAVGDDDHSPWVYTIGLVDGFEHPEFIMAGASVETMRRTISAWADAVTEGHRYDVGDTFTVLDNSIVLGGVHDVQYERSTFAYWHNLRDGAFSSPTN